MQYPEFQRNGWPIGSGMVESANKNVVEARLKRPGMHWERKNVNPILALRNAVCNDRWREMWQKAVLQHQKLQALQRSVRAEQRAQALSTAMPEQLSPSFQPVSEAEASPVSPPPPVPEASQPSSCRLSSRHKRPSTRNQGEYAHQKSSEMSKEVCRCGTPLVQSVGGRTREYCSDRCRQREHRKRQAQARLISVPLAPIPTAPPPDFSHAPHQRKRRLKLETKRINLKIKGETCLCGTRLLQSREGRTREYCSGRCRQRAHRERQTQVP